MWEVLLARRSRATSLPPFSPMSFPAVTGSRWGGISVQTAPSVCVGGRRGGIMGSLGSASVLSEVLIFVPSGPQRASTSIFVPLGPMLLPGRCKSTR